MKGQITAVYRCARYLTDNWNSLDVYPVKMDNGKWYIRHSAPGQPVFSSTTVRNTVLLLGWIGIPGYKGAHNNPIGSQLYVHIGNLKNYGERTDNKA